MKDDKRLKRKVRNSYIVSNISIALVLFLFIMLINVTLNALLKRNKEK